MNIEHRNGIIFIAILLPTLLLGETSAKSISLFNSKDLTGWEITDYGTQGQVEVESGKLVLGMGDGATGVTWTGDLEFPKMNYEVTLKAQRISGNDFFCGMTFPVNDDHLTLIVGGWGGFLVGLSCIDDFDASENETGCMRKFENKRWYEIRIRVAVNVVKAWIDDELLIDISIADRQLSLRPEVLLSRPFGITTWKTEAALRHIKLTLLD
jgi:hypothetical protein